MITFPQRPLLALFTTAAVAIAVGVHAQPSSPTDADAMHAKIERMAAAADSPRPPGVSPLRTAFTDREINAYLEYYGETFLPAGIAKPRGTLLDGGRVVAHAIVDFDAVRRARERSLFDPLGYLQGSLEVVAAGTIAGSGGRGIIRFESATVGGVSVPKRVAQELLRFYTRTPQRPNGFQFDEPFVLPANVQSVSVARGSATVTQ